MIEVAKFGGLFYCWSVGPIFDKYLLPLDAICHLVA